METFENGDSSYSYGGGKTEVFEYDDAMPRFKAHPSAHTIQKRCVDADFFLNTGEKISVLESTRRYVWIDEA